MEADSDLNVHKDPALGSLASFTLANLKQKFTKGMFLRAILLSPIISSI